MSEANTLISPCKKLKLGPDDEVETVKHETDVTNVDDVEKVKHESDVTNKNEPMSCGNHGKDDDISDKVSEDELLEKPDLNDENTVSGIMSAFDAMDGAKSEPISGKYIDNATAMLADVGDSISSTEQFEYLDGTHKDDESQDGSPVLVEDDNYSSSSSVIDEFEYLAGMHKDDHCQGDGSLVLFDDGDNYSSNSSVIDELDTLEDIQGSLDVVNACKEEIDILIDNRKTEIKAICSSVDVSALIKRMETIKNKKQTEEEGITEDSPNPGLITELDTSMTSESTDDLNSSSVTVTDDPCRKNDSHNVNNDEEIDNEQDPDLLNDTAVAKTDDENLDDTLHDDNEDEERHYEHVYANVVVNSVEKRHRKSGSENKAEFNDLQTDDKRNTESRNGLSLQNSEHGNILERTLGEGKECGGDTSNYFCVVNGEAMRNVDDNYREITGEFNGEETVSQPVSSGMVSMSVSRIQTMSRPLCASTPLPQSHPNMIENESRKQYASASHGTNEHVKKQSQSGPLLTSTPVVKVSEGLKMRDMNIMRSSEEKKHVKFAQKMETKTDLDIYNEFSNENEKQSYENLIAKNNERNTRKENQLNSGSLKRDRKSKREKRKLAGVRVEKFKEYMGPGLTSGMNSENVSEVVVDSSSKNLVKNSDIETCTLTEYKGFGLTGPLPDRPLQTSTPLPPCVDKPDQAGHKDSSNKNEDCAPALKRCLSGISLGGKPAGTEGFLLDFHTTSNTDNVTNVNLMKSCPGGQKLRQTVSESKFGQKANLIVGDLNTRTLTRHTSDLGPQSHNKQNRLTGWLASVQAQKAPLATLHEHGQQAQTALLRPDVAYPSVTSVRGDNSEGNSNTDKSDKSEKTAIDPQVLQNSGQLKVSAYMNFGLLTVHVIQGRQLATKWKNLCDSFVKLSLLPDDGKKPKCRTDVIQDTNNPLYDEKFSFELNEEDHNKRLMVSVWHRDTQAGVNEFLGSMSFGIRHLTNPKKEVNGWYYLLTEDVGRKKHLQVSHRQHPQLKIRNQSHIPSVNKDVWGTESVSLTLHRGKTGFGFSVIEACPVRVGRVDGASPAERAGLQPGDIIVRLNKQNVSRSTATSVAKLIKNSNNTMMLELHRPRPITYEHLENSPLSNTTLGNNTESCNYGNDYTNNTYRDQSVPQMYTLNDDEDKENEVSLEDQTLYPINPHIASLATSTPLPLLARGHRTVQTCEVRKQEAIHRLLSLELDFIDLMHAGMQRYSRPLRHCILSHSHHSALFQNIEKLVTISEYHVKQMHDNAPSSFVSEDDTDTSASSDNHNFIHSIGLIYQSKVHMLCQAYDLYAKGISTANHLLSELRKNEDFVRFVRDPPLEGNQPSISTFIYRPVQHIRELYKVVQEVFTNTSNGSSDYNSLKELTEVLQECSTNITNYSCERVESLTSLTSKDSKVSFTGSMKSRSSSTSCSSASSKGHSLQTSKSVDHEVMKIQDRLIFASNVPVFQLCQDDRHLIFSGEMFKREGQQWMKIHVYLFTDLILQTVRESDGYLKVIQEPTMLRDIAAMDSQRQHGTEFVLYTASRQSGKRKLNFRAPSTEQKMAWKSLIEQRVFAVRGSMDYYSSTSDVSSSSSSAIVI